jgi:branched-subunit amino acid transport protein
MSESDIWLTIALMALATVMTRSSFFLTGRAVRLPHKLQHALRYAPAAALAAIVVPDLVLTSGTLTDALLNPKLLAALGAVLIFVLSRHLLATIIGGMALFSLLRLVL